MDCTLQQLRVDVYRKCVDLAFFLEKVRRFLSRANSRGPRWGDLVGNIAATVGEVLTLQAPSRQVAASVLVFLWESIYTQDWEEMPTWTGERCRDALRRVTTIPPRALGRSTCWSINNGHLLS